MLQKDVDRLGDWAVENAMEINPSKSKAAEGRKTRDRPRRTWKDGIYTAMNERNLRMGEWNKRRQ
jgi:hypothetical protein